MRQLFDGYDLDRIVRVMPRQVTTAPNNLMLREDRGLSSGKAAPGPHMFRRDGLANKLPLLAWAVWLFC